MPPSNQPIKADGTSEKMSTHVDVWMSREMFDALTLIRGSRAIHKGHRLTMADLGREAFLLLIQQEKDTHNGLSSTIHPGMGSTAASVAA